MNNEQRAIVEHPVGAADLGQAETRVESIDRRRNE
jgi:hypothetical protein